MDNAYKLKWIALKTNWPPGYLYNSVKCIIFIFFIDKQKRL